LTKNIEWEEKSAVSEVFLHRGSALRPTTAKLKRTAERRAEMGYTIMTGSHETSSYNTVFVQNEKMLKKNIYH
jgi:hypothetical protein